jgi:hAT family C-terminal dimerisation region
LDVKYKKKTEVEHSAAPEGFEDESVELEMESSQSDPFHSMVAASPASAETAVAIPEGMELSMHVEEIEETGGLAFLDDDDIEGNRRLQVFPELEENLDCLILKVRKVVCMFKNSPTRNDEFLQKHVRDEFGKELRLLLDTKTRWSSLFSMLERFYLIRNAVRKALIDLKLQPSIVFTDQEFEHIHNVVQALQVIKLTVEVVCRRDSNLLTADAALRFMLKKLRAQKTALGTDLANALSRRIRQRRSNLSGVMLYLQDPKAAEQEDDDEDSYLFSVPTTAEIRKTVKELVQRLDESKDGHVIDSASVINSSAGSQECEALQATLAATSKTLSVEEEMDLAIRSSICKPVTSASTSQELMKVIRQEMTLFESGGTRGRYLQLVYDYIMSVPPTSVEAERAFSAAGIICSRLRTRLGDETLDSLCFLRSYFQKHA